MDRFFKSLGASLGKKWMMAGTGLCFCGFLTAHLLGNLNLLGGRDAFNTYAERLHSLGVVITVAEVGLLLFALIHVTTGVFLFVENIWARPVRYKVKKSAGGRTIGSATMPYTGFLMLMFIVIHLLDFHFVDKTGTTIFQIVADAFANPLRMFGYVCAMVVVAVHVSHGLWSAFQSLGLAHTRYTPMIRIVSLVFSLVFGLGFGFLPVYVSLLS